MFDVTSRNVVMSYPNASSKARGRGFKRTSVLLQGRIRDASAGRGFSESRLLTHWEETAGPQMAAISRPVEVSYGRGGMGATLVLLTTGAHAPMLEMEKEKLRTKVNAIYGYNAISRIRITQTAPMGFSEGQAAFSPAPKAEKAGPSRDDHARAAQTTRPVHDDSLRQALENLGANIISRSKR